MTTENLTIQEVYEPQAQNKHPYKIGKPYFIRTVTMAIVGNLEQVFCNELVLSKASWVADTGRFSNAINKGTLNEVEPFNFEEDVIIGRHSIIDATIWCHKLPTKQI